MLKKNQFWTLVPPRICSNQCKSKGKQLQKIEKKFFFRFSSNCLKCYLKLLKRFLCALWHSKQPQKFLNTSCDHLKKSFLIEFSIFGSHFLLMELTTTLKMTIYEGFQNLKGFPRWNLWPRYNVGNFIRSFRNFL